MVKTDGRDIGDRYRKVVHCVDNGRLLFFNGKPHCRADIQSVDLFSNRIVGYTTPTAELQDSFMRTATEQIALGVPASGIFTLEVQEAIRRKLERDGPSDDVWQAFLGCLGYMPGETSKFQTIEGLTVTGVADRASWERAYQYLMPYQKRGVLCQ